MSEKPKKQTTLVDEPIKAIPLDQRQHWLTPAIVFGGLEFCVPVMMIGSTLVMNFTMPTIIIITLLAMVLITWPINAIAGFIGAKGGKASSVAARDSFGESQARFVIAVAIAIVVLGHWGMQTAVAGNAICAMLGIDYTVEKGLWALIVIVAGLVFAIPSVMGYSSMKWTDFVAVPAGILLCVFGIYYAFKVSGGLEGIMHYTPIAAGGMSVIAGLNLVASLNSAQCVVALDYTRVAKPTWRDNIKIPLGIIAIGFPLVIVGSAMAVGNGTPDIVAVMTDLGFPVWGFIVLWLSTWTSQLCNNYTAGLSLANAFNANSNKGRMIVTFGASIFAIIMSLLGILDHLVDLYIVTGCVFPAIAGVIMADFLLRQKGYEYDAGSWNWTATIALVIGGAVGIGTAYVVVVGIPVIQTLGATFLIYYYSMKSKLGKADEKKAV